MRNALWIVGLSALSVGAHANDKTYSWVLEQFETKNEAAIDSHSVGTLDGEQHLAVIATHEDPLLTVFKRGSKRYVGVAQTFSLPLTSSVEIKKNSLFLETNYCHHGCTTERYQFKYVGELLKLVGVESQRDTNSCYYDEKNMPYDCAKYEVRLGNSYNLLTSASICWLETTYVDDDALTGQKSYKVPRLFQPGGVQHKMASQRIELPLLDGFDLYNKVSLPKSCYFDSLLSKTGYDVGSSGGVGYR